ncbi:hypothetical protein HAX54_047649, partial [Datura stramonium]|nr:hypothetical protein [Datura stramonium]
PSSFDTDNTIPISNSRRCAASRRASTLGARLIALNATTRLSPYFTTIVARATTHHYRAEVTTTTLPPKVTNTTTILRLNKLPLRRPTSPLRRPSIAVAPPFPNSHRRPIAPRLIFTLPRPSLTPPFDSNLKSSTVSPQQINNPINIIPYPN